MHALSIRQPFAELILRGIKTVEYRSRPTRIIGERFLIYASKKSAVSSRQSAGKTPWSDDLTGAAAPPWIAELANGLRLFPHELPTGVIVGSAVISRCELVGGPQSAVGSEEDAALLPTADCPLPTYYQWHLTDVRRAKTLRKPKGHPQPVWWRV